MLCTPPDENAHPYLGIVERLTRGVHLYHFIVG